MVRRRRTIFKTGAWSRYSSPQPQAAKSTRDAPFPEPRPPFASLRLSPSPLRHSRSSRGRSAPLHDVPEPWCWHSMSIYSASFSRSSTYLDCAEPSGPECLNRQHGACDGVRKLQCACAWGTAGGIPVVGRPQQKRTQELTPDLESGPGSHPRTSVDVRRRPHTPSSQNINIAASIDDHARCRKILDRRTH